MKDHISPEFKRALDELTGGCTLQVLNALKHSSLTPDTHPFAAMTVFLAAFNKVALGAPKEARELVLALISENLKALESRWKMKAGGVVKEESRIILPFNN